MLLVAVGELHCKDGAKWCFEKSCVLDGGIIEVREDLCECCKDQVFMLDNNNEPDDNFHELDESENSYCDDDAEKKIMSTVIMKFEQTNYRVMFNISIKHLDLPILAFVDI